MVADIKSILDKIEENGFEAYVVGGYVRDFLLGIDSVDIDICTNALPKDIINIFNIKKETVSYGSITLKQGKYNFDITTYRKESSYVNRRPQNIEYTNNLLEDIKRRDFTMNSLCMNSNGKIFDYLNGKEDIKNKTIRVIGDIDKRFSEDPLRILRAIRFAVTLEFDLSPEIISFIVNHKDLINSLSFTRKKEELDKIFSSKYVLNGLKLLKELDLLDVLGISYDKIVNVPDLLGIWAQVNFSEKYPFTKNNLNSIKKIRNILNEGVITNYTLYRDGLYISLVAGEILGYSSKKISKLYHGLIITSDKELAIKPNDIVKILAIKPSAIIKVIFNNVLIKVLDKELPNSYEDIKRYIIDNWK